MAVLTKDQILQADDLPKELVEVPEWGGEVWVRTLTGEERDSFESSIIELKQKGKKTTREHRLENMRAKLCAKCMVDEDGERLFTDAEVGALGKKSARALDRVFEVAQRLNGVGEDDVEELAGN